MAVLALKEGWISVGRKVAVVATLIVFTQIAMFKHEPGWPVGAFCLACATACGVLLPGLWRRPVATGFLVLAAALAVVLADELSLLGLLMFWVLLSAAALESLLQPFGNALLLAQRLITHGLLSLFGPLQDFLEGVSSLPRGSLRRWLAAAPIVILPLVGGLLFLALFAAANPVLAEWLSAIQWLRLDEEFFVRTIFAGFVTIVVWGFLRPRLVTMPSPAAAEPLKLSVATLALSLIVFNALFALQNGLDLAFLWSGAPLPGHVTMADYAHRGAYTLIGTAILAGLFVVVFLHPSAPAAQSRLVRILVVLWTLQTLFLVASSVLRTTDYVQAYGLTKLRLAALVWMAMVAVGLALIAWRLIANRSASWLINANALAALAVLSVSSAVDYGAIVARWNIDHPNLSGGIDICYLKSLREPALISMAMLEQRQLDPLVRDEVATMRGDLQRAVIKSMSDPFSWRFRTARRLRTLQSLQPNGPQPSAIRRNCNGAPLPAATSSVY
ncbi:MAG TPA: DUF4173 domain-containing protein [Caulobacteraceae bacterium]|nr:DUF4173 domain-containing protein [Caulobacteraceae bacterium]